MSTSFEPNSHKSKRDREEQKREIKPVVSGAAKTKKKSGIHGLKDVFISEDVSNVRSYIFMDVLIPAAKKAIYDVITNGIDMVLYGGKGGGGGNSNRNNAPYVSYRQYSEPRDRGRANEGVASRTRFDYDDIVFASKGDAEAVLSQMIDIIKRYDGFVTVADLYDLADLTQPYTSNRYGWTNLRNASTRRVRDGYILDLPKPMPIDD